jgi:hypothetical protein
MRLSGGRIRDCTKVVKGFHEIVCIQLGNVCQKKFNISIDFWDNSGTRLLDEYIFTYTPHVWSPCSTGKNGCSP